MEDQSAKYVAELEAERKLSRTVMRAIIGCLTKSGAFLREDLKSLPYLLASEGTGDASAAYLKWLYGLVEEAGRNAADEIPIRLTLTSSTERN
jgi:hypothetical protein